MLGYGGGPAIIPLYQDQVVNRMKWLTKEEFGNAIAFSNALPGPIATKLAAYIGYKTAGWAGVAVATAAVILPTAIIMIILVGVMSKVSNNAYIKGMIRGVQPVIFVMMAMLAYEFSSFAFEKSRGPVSFLPFLIAAAYFVMVQYFQLSAVWGILLSLAVGAFFLKG